MTEAFAPGSLIQCNTEFAYFTETLNLCEDGITRWSDEAIDAPALVVATRRGSVNNVCYVITPSNVSWLHVRSSSDAWQSLESVDL